jgi:hypothetical protein
VVAEEGKGRQEVVVLNTLAKRVVRVVVLFVPHRVGLV